MNLRNEIVLEIQQAEKNFRAHFPHGVTYQECYDFLVKCAEKIVEMSKSQEAAQQSQASAPAESNSSSEAPSASA